MRLRNTPIKKVNDLLERVQLLNCKKQKQYCASAKFKDKLSVFHCYKNESLV